MNEVKKIIFIPFLMLLIFSCRPKTQQEAAIEEAENMAKEFFQMSPEETIKMANDSLKKNPNDYDIYLTRASAYSIVKQYDKALQDYNQAVTLISRPLDSLISGQLDSTITINAAIRHSAAFIYVGRGGVKRKLDLDQEALEDYNIAIKIKPDHGQAYFSRGLLKHELGDRESGCSDLRKAMELEPDMEMYQTEFNRNCR